MADGFDLFEEAAEALAEASAPQEPTEDEKLQLAYQAVTAKADGITVLRHIMNLAGFHDRLVRTNGESEVNMHATLYNLAQRDMWLQVRRYLSPTQIRAIENPEE